MKEFVMKLAWKGGACVVLTLLLLAAAAPAAAQKNKKKKNVPATADSSLSAAGKLLLAPDSQVIDRTVGEYLGYWQVGDVDSMHKYCADDMLVVSGAWEPPVIGWDNYVKAYQAQRAQVTGGRMDRSNTYIKVNGNSAWATYQFYYAAIAEGKVVEFRGHTTLVLNKQGDRWVIVLNHSSVVSATEPRSPAPPVEPAQPRQP
ncbi:MAG: nuclear transport factor 2 family protein [Acidobacteriia bacterium]|nr:nuclear transport factor 2 family protein [Terriglobia bacterium]